MIQHAGPLSFRCWLAVQAEYHNRACQAFHQTGASCDKHMRLMLTATQQHVASTSSHSVPCQGSSAARQQVVALALFATSSLTASLPTCGLMRLRMRPALRPAMSIGLTQCFTPLAA